MPRVSTKKNYYELKKSERRDYFEEFNDINYIKAIKNKKDPILCINMMLWVMVIVISKFVNFDLVLPNAVCYMKWAAILLLLYYIFLESYYRISFMRWLKIKHKVDY